MEGYWKLFVCTGNPLACLLYLRTQGADNKTADGAADGAADRPAG